MAGLIPHKKHKADEVLGYDMRLASPATASLSLSCFFYLSLARIATDQLFEVVVAVVVVVVVLFAVVVVVVFRCCYCYSFCSW